jgi:hypothetical protein
VHHLSHQDVKQYAFHVRRVERVRDLARDLARDLEREATIAKSVPQFAPHLPLLHHQVHQPHRHPPQFFLAKNNVSLPPAILVRADPRAPRAREAILRKARVKVEARAEAKAEARAQARVKAEARAQAKARVKAEARVEAKA